MATVYTQAQVDALLATKASAATLATAAIYLKANPDGSWPVRPNYPAKVIWEGPTAPTIRTDGVTTGGDNRAVDGLDDWDLTP